MPLIHTYIVSIVALKRLWLVFIATLHFCVCVRSFLTTGWLAPLTMDGSQLRSHANQICYQFNITTSVTKNAGLVEELMV